MTDQPDSGQDSFLDIVANLVGIMIILVVVVGVQANQEWTKPQEAPGTATVEELESEIAKQSLTHSKWKADQERLQQDIQREQQAVESLANWQHRLLVEMELMSGKIEAARESLSEHQKAAAAQQVQLASLEMKREQIQQKIVAQQALHSETVSQTIEHYPTPIAKTVFLEEIHFRLLEGKLVYVPVDELLERMKREWKFKAEKLARVRRTVETVAEIDGFRMQYQLGKIPERRQTEFGELNRETIRFMGFKILPTRPGMGEKIETALENGSEFSRRLSHYQPGRTTVSVWVYPDSYREYEQLKTWLHQQGYQSAAWPLADGDLISGSPNGLRSTAQ